MKEVYKTALHLLNYFDENKENEPKEDNMAAATNEMRNYLRTTIGIADSTGNDPNARREAIRDEGLQVIEDFAEFHDDDGIKTLCASVRKPGGTVVDPNNPNNSIPNPGHSIPAICEKRMKFAAYGAMLYGQIGRNVTSDSLSRPRLKEFDKHAKIVEEHQEPESLPVISKTFGIMKAMDVFPSHLRERIGTAKVALSYVIRKEVNPAQMRALKRDDICSEGYEDFMSELIDKVDLTGQNYQEDNAKVFQIMQDMVSGTSHEASIKVHRRSRDGRAAYLALCKHNLGSSKWDRVIEECENYLMKREWNGKNHRFTLKMHISKHRDAFNELTRASQFVAYELPNEVTRVSRLLKSVTSKDATILSAITTIKSNKTMKGNFEEAADFLLLTAPHPKEIETSYRISAINMQNDSDKKGGKPKEKGKTGVELRYYKQHEYARLNDAQKRELQDWRKEKKASKKARISAVGTKSEEEAKFGRLEEMIKELTNQNKNLQERVSALSTKPSAGPLKNPLNQRGNANT